MWLATKVGKPMGPDKKGLKPAYIRQAVEDSLRRLQTDVIDLYQSHDDDADTPLEDTLGAFADLIRAGKVRAIGASNYSAARLELALQTSARLGLPRYESLQPLYNLYDRAVFEDALGPLCRREQVGVINFYALAAGFLSGKYRSEADTAGTLRPEAILYSGGGSQNYTNRWGDYSAMSLDPNGCRFWFTSEYYASTGSNWRTRIGSFRGPASTQCP